METTIILNDPIENTQLEAEVLEIQDLTERSGSPRKDGAELVLVNIPDLGMPSIIRWPDGKLFSTTDWQSKQPKDAEEIEDYQWMDLDTGITAIMLENLPRAFPS